MPWFSCVDRSCHYKSHLIDTRFKEQLVEDLEGRGKGFKLDEELSGENSGTYFEPGGYGMYALHQPQRIFTVRGKTLKLDSAKVPEALSELRSAKRHVFSDGTEYVKLYSRFWCLVLTLPEREELLFQLTGQLKETIAEADAFFEEHEKGWQQMRKKWKEEHGKPFPILRLEDLKKKDDPN